MFRDVVAAFALLLLIANVGNFGGEAIARPVMPDEIHELVTRGDADAVRALLERDPSLLEARDERGQTPLHLATRGESAEIVRLLIEAGAEIDSRDRYQRAPFWYAAWRHDDLGILRLLLAHGADVNAVGFLDITPLEISLYNRSEAVIDFILDNGTALPAETDHQFRLMHTAASEGSSRVFDLMFENFLTLDPAGDDAIAVFRAGAEGGSAAVLERLLATGIDADSPDAYQGVPIHTTSRGGFTEATVALIAHGADMNRRTATGDSPYNLAMANGHAELANRLVELGADTSSPQPPLLVGDYLGEPLPGREPLTFAPGIISRGGSTAIHATTVFSRDGNEVYWSDGAGAPISFMRRVDGRWTMPALVPFTTGYNDDLPMFSPDGKRLYFLSSMPVDDRAATDQEFLWYVERESGDDAWSEPIPGPASINAVRLHWQFSIAPNGDFYIPTTTEDSLGTDIHVSRLVDGEYGAVEPIEGPLNTTGDEHMPFIAPDDSYMVFAARNRPGGTADYRLYVSFRGPDGFFQEAILLPEAINAQGARICPVVTADGKYLFYVAGTEVRWVSTDIIEALR